MRQRNITHGWVLSLKWQAALDPKITWNDDYKISQYGALLFMQTIERCILFSIIRHKRSWEWLDGNNKIRSLA